MNKEYDDTNSNKHVLLACENGKVLGPLNNISGITANTPIFLGSVTVDTDALCNSSILLTITGEIGVSFSAVLKSSFRITKSCDSFPGEIIKTFNFDSSPPPNLARESFSLQFCDDDICCNCIKYTLEFIPGNLDLQSYLLIKNIVISAKEINYFHSQYENKNPDNCLVKSKCVSNISDVSTGISDNSKIFIPIKIGSITVDTTDFCEPKILLTFTGKLSNPSLIFQESFIVTKTCNGVTTQLSGTLESGLHLNQLYEYFSYQLCDCSSCENCDCITYNIEIIPQLFSGTPSVISNFLISTFVAEKNNCEFNCTSGNRISFTNSSSPSTNESIVVNPLDIGSISVDVSNYCNPKALLTFTGDIAKLTAFTILDTDYFFKIIRTCDGCFSEEINTELTAIKFAIPFDSRIFNEAFSYQLCDDNIPCDCDCINYTVQFISRNPILSGTTVIVDNVVLSAFVMENC